MSLFEDEHYQFRDTYFVLFEGRSCPKSERIQSVLAGLGTRYKVSEVRENQGQFESVTVLSPYDNSAMDIVYVDGEEVVAQVKDLIEAFRTLTLTGDDAQKIARLKRCNSRFDIYHFEETDTATGEDEFLDPGGLLLVIQKLIDLSGGVSVDPQSMTFI